MSEWIANNLSTIIISLILLVIFALIIYRLYVNHKNHKPSCGHNCAGCAMSETCHKNLQKD